MTEDWPKIFPAVDAMTFVNSGQDKVLHEFVLRSTNVGLEPAAGVQKHFRGRVDYLKVSVFNLAP